MTTPTPSDIARAMQRQQALDMLRHALMDTITGAMLADLSPSEIHEQLLAAARHVSGMTNA